MDSFATRFDALREALAAWLASPSFYFQGTAIVAVLLIASALTPLLRRSIPVLHDEPEGDARIRRLIYRTRVIVFPLLVVLLLAIAIRISEALFSESWLFLIAQGIAVAVLLQMLVRRFVDNRLIAILLTWVGIPLATLQVFGWLDDVARELNSIAISVGNIRLSALAIGRTLFFGTILFWLGRVSNDSGKEAIRNYPNLDQGTREVIAKLFEIVVFVALFLLLLQVMGINLTALAVFGGALGIGLGMGMQRIAANFISGVIILLERSLSLGDYVELADGRAGTVRELNMRAATLETFDGKDIVVPNETFVSESFTNWTHHDTKQRYEFEFGVAYDTDLPPMLDLVMRVVASHPQVRSGPDVHEDEQPSAEIKSFGDSAINIEVEFWMEGIDDGPNDVRASLRLMLWSALREHGIEMPFPQREIRILQGGAWKEGKSPT
ncbi:MAG TPA: mechanosensitive ion channel domain-containing protein [Gemmatimonadaceae bacterium]|nr:mechanosensitive ion channel domain-containing protein [Gemmatimonadaceae bacterium]